MRAILPAVEAIRIEDKPITSFYSNGAIVSFNLQIFISKTFFKENNASIYVNLKSGENFNIKGSSFKEVIDNDLSVIQENKNALIKRIPVVVNLPESTQISYTEVTGEENFVNKQPSTFSELNRGISERKYFAKLLEKNVDPLMDSGLTAEGSVDVNSIYYNKLVNASQIMTSKTAESDFQPIEAKIENIRLDDFLSVNIINFYVENKNFQQSVSMKFNSVEIMSLFQSTMTRSSTKGNIYEEKQLYRNLKSAINLQSLRWSSEVDSVGKFTSGKLIERNFYETNKKIPPVFSSNTKSNCTGNFPSVFEIPFYVDTSSSDSIKFVIPSLPFNSKTVMIAIYEDNRIIFRSNTFVASSNLEFDISRNDLPNSRFLQARILIDEKETNNSLSLNMKNSFNFSLDYSVLSDDADKNFKQISLTSTSSKTIAVAIETISLKDGSQDFTEIKKINPLSSAIVSVPYNEFGCVYTIHQIFSNIEKSTIWNYQERSSTKTFRIPGKEIILPKISEINVISTPWKTNLLEWAISGGNPNEIDHFQIMTFSELTGVETLLSCTFKSLKFEDFVFSKNLGSLRYSVRPIYLDFSTGDWMSIAASGAMTDLKSSQTDNFKQSNEIIVPSINTVRNVVFDTSINPISGKSLAKNEKTMSLLSDAKFKATTGIVATGIDSRISTVFGVSATDTTLFESSMSSNVEEISTNQTTRYTSNNVITKV